MTIGEAICPEICRSFVKEKIAKRREYKLPGNLTELQVTRKLDSRIQYSHPETKDRASEKLVEAVATSTRLRIVKVRLEI